MLRENVKQRLITQDIFIIINLLKGSLKNHIIGVLFPPTPLTLQNQISSCQKTFDLSGRGLGLEPPKASLCNVKLPGKQQQHESQSGSGFSLLLHHLLTGYRSIISHLHRELQLFLIRLSTSLPVYTLFFLLRTTFLFSVSRTHAHQFT